jgi:cell division septation protein DedD
MRLAGRPARVVGLTHQTRSGITVISQAVAQIDRDRRVSSAFRWAILGCLVAAFLSAAGPRVAFADYTQAVAAFDAGEYGLALDGFGDAYNAGDSRAAYMLGRMHHLGAGMEKPDEKRAATWYRNAAIGGHVKAQNVLGFIYRDGVGVPADNVEAYVWFALAADGGHVMSGTYRDLVERRLDAGRLAKANAVFRKRREEIAVGRVDPALSATSETPDRAAEPKTEFVVRTVPPPDIPPPVIPAPELAAPDTVAPEITMPDIPPPEAAPAPAVANVEPEPVAPAEKPIVDEAYLVQLGAFSVAENPAKAWSLAETAHPDLLAGLEPQVIKFDRADGRELYLLRAGPLDSHDAAQSLCSDLKAKMIDCIVIAP